MPDAGPIDMVWNFCESIVQSTEYSKMYIVSTVPIADESLCS